MNPKPLAQVIALVKTMKSGREWDAMDTQAFMIGLADVPDSVAPFLLRQILQRWEWRPSVKDVFDLAVSIASPHPTYATAADAVLALEAAVNTPRFVTATTTYPETVWVPLAEITDLPADDPDAPPTVPKLGGDYGRYHRAQRRRRALEAGGENQDRTRVVEYQDVDNSLPADVADDPILSRIVAVMGGWDVVRSGGRGDNSRDQAMYRAMLIKVAGQVIAGEDGRRLEAVRQEYRTGLGYSALKLIEGGEYVDDAGAIDAEYATVLHMAR